MQPVGHYRGPVWCLAYGRSSGIHVVLTVGDSLPSSGVWSIVSACATSSAGGSSSADKRARGFLEVFLGQAPLPIGQSAVNVVREMFPRGSIGGLLQAALMSPACIAGNQARNLLVQKAELTAEQAERIAKPRFGKLSAVGPCKLCGNIASATWHPSSPGVICKSCYNKAYRRKKKASLTPKVEVVQPEQFGASQH